jgi:hypothetical protein
LGIVIAFVAGRLKTGPSEILNLYQIFCFKQGVFQLLFPAFAEPMALD